MKIVFYYFLALIYFISLNINAEDKNDNFKYVTTKSTKTNVRSGPDSNYIIKYTYIKKNTVLKIKNILDEWYEVEDLEGDKGWIYKNLVSKSKKIHYVTIKSKEDIKCYKNPDIKSEAVFKASYLSNFKLKKCNEIKWCLIEKEKIKAWCENKYLWGL